MSLILPLVLALFRLLLLKLPVWFSACLLREVILNHSGGYLTNNWLGHVRHILLYLCLSVIYVFGSLPCVKASFVHACSRLCSNDRSYKLVEQIHTHSYRCPSLPVP